MNNDELMRYLLATMEEVAKGHFTPKVAAQEVMAAILDREKAIAREGEDNEENERFSTAVNNGAISWPN